MKPRYVLMVGLIITLSGPTQGRSPWNRLLGGMRYRPAQQVPMQQIPTRRPLLHRLTPTQLDQYYGPSILVRDSAAKARSHEAFPNSGGRSQRG